MPTVNTVEGLEETLANLRELPQRVGRLALRKALLKAAEPVAVVARSLAPDDPNTPAPDLRSSIIVSGSLTRSQRRSKPKQNEVEVYVGPSRSAGRNVLNYASFQEFGTIKQPPHPYMRPAWDRMQPVVLKILSDELAKQVEAAAGRVSRKFFKLR